MPIVTICKCDHEEYNHNFDENMTWAVGQSCFKCDCNQFRADNLRTLEKAIGPTVSVQKLRPPL
jgi:hypothetical protein